MAERLVMNGDEPQEGIGRNSSSVSRSTKAERRIEKGAQLLPGILDDITLSAIAPKLPWKAFYILALVSPCWNQAIKSRQVYDARLRLKSTQTLVPIERQHPDGCFYKMALQCLEDGSCCDLPGIPGGKFDSGFPAPAYQWIPLDGKIYALGGYSDMSAGSRTRKMLSDVYVFDLAGQRPWKQCASMKSARARFGCGIKDGKIYVFGGTSSPGSLYASEVYDPMQDTWSPITPIPYFRYYAKVTTVGEEIFVQNSQFNFRRVRPLAARSTHVYHPQKDEWTILKNFIPPFEVKKLLM